MGKLDSLKISDCPFAFASFAAKHNALVDLLASTVGENGISVTIAEKNAIIRGAGGTGGNVTIDNVATANVVGANGLLQNAYIGDAIANAYPTELRVVNGTKSIIIDANGIAMENSADSSYIRLMFTGPDIQVHINQIGLERFLQLINTDMCDGVDTGQVYVLRSEL